jgi:pyrroline-5-carboxylate reductase
MTVLTRLQTISSHISTKVTSKPVISFIGAGNMTEAILSGLQSSGYPPSYLRYSEPVDKRRDYMESKYPQITGFNDNTKAVQGADVVILAVKPQVLRSVITSTTFADSPSALIISLVGGITIRDIDRCLKTKHAIVRCMPNTPALIGEGAVGLYATEYVNSQQRDLTENIMKSISKQVSWINDESLMNTVTAISGSGPAYFFLMMEAMRK